MAWRDGILLGTGWASGGIACEYTDGLLLQIVLAVAVGLLIGLILAVVDERHEAAQ